ncbi:tol-pal system protein YbgF [Phytopseudomonas dryadis]|uniref:Cell division coordinator CpoB n=1 Tax=Phytopseudomonas dryadis TaxID=2487520 RepID=A0A4Q9QZB5_9GAMM|nr:tol-pal system protein YbgF [Pseudomonas dryadis]TBU89973.1 tol-pal system protein YbgF [Pseudomonas dryadis]
MRTCRRVVTVMALSLPLAAWAQIPVQDGSTGNGSAYPSGGYGASGAYVGGGAETPTSAQGMLFTQLQQMQQEIAQLRGMLEEQQNEVQRLKQEGLERYQELDRRLGSGAAAGAAATQNSPAAGASGTGGSTASGGDAGQAQASGEPADPAKEKLFYDAAFDLIKAKDFDKASQAFSAFLRRYPDSQYAGNAQYWLGEVNLAKGDLQGAGQAFARVSQAYPQHAKVPDSLFKLADVEIRLGNNDKAKGILQQVIAQYPGTSAAQLSQRDLQRLQ